MNVRGYPVSGISARILLLCALVLGVSTGYSQDDESVYDPFIDYSEFEEAGEEEADINFFRNGRLLTAALAVGQRTFTEGMADVLEKDVAYGFVFSYFFDLRFAMQLSYMVGNHALEVSGGGNTVNGEVKMNHLGLDMKYYFNMQNVTKGLAAFNPYILGGFSSVSRESNRAGQTEFSADRAMAFDAGVGFEFPILRNEMYMGAQALYQVVSFKGENEQLLANGSPTGKYANGDLVTFTLMIGKNF